MILDEWYMVEYHYSSTTIYLKVLLAGSSMHINTTASDQDLLALIREKSISVADPTIINKAQRYLQVIQPSSLDLRVGSRAWLMRGSSRPLQDETISDLIQRSAIQEYDLQAGASLLRDSIYLVQLQETTQIGPLAHLRANPKSSSGRLDLQVRLLTDHNPHYDTLRGPYQGGMYVEVIPNSFHVFLQPGTSLNQLRYSLGNPVMSDDEVRSVLMNQPLVYTKEGKSLSREKCAIDSGIVLTVDLNGKHTGSGIIGYRAKKNNGLVVDLQKKQQYPWSEFFEPLNIPKNKELLLEPGYFYLLSTDEAVSIPPGFAGELAQFDPRMGHLTTHYAGFFDEGFGYFPGKKIQGNTATLEARVHNKPELICDGQPICVLRLERMAWPAKFPYGCPERSSHYARQIGVRYGKYFR